MRGGAILIAVVCLSAAHPFPAAAQDTVSQRQDTARKDSVPPPPPPPPPTPAQERYANGLRHASRGIAQLKDGLERVARTRSTSDSVKQRTAGRRLGGLCAAARGFMASGRAQMLPTAYDPPTRTVARQLGQQIDSLIAYAPTCERTAARRPGPVADRLTDLLRKYETAVASWRAAVGLPNR
jgi:hypothetical protein